jgi:hypothetical protein
MKRTATAVVSRDGVLENQTGMSLLTVHRSLVTSHRTGRQPQ